MKIIQVHNYYQQAGGEDAVVAAERALLEAKGDVVMPYYRSNDDIAASSNKLLAIADLLKASLRTIWNWQTYKEFRKLLQIETPDVVHCHNTFPLISPSIYWACEKEGIPVVQTLHNYRFSCLNAFLFRLKRKKHGAGSMGQGDDATANEHGNQNVCGSAALRENNNGVCELCVGKRFKWPGIRYRCYRSSLPGSLVVAMMLFVHKLLGTWSKKVTAYIALTEFQKQMMVEEGLPEDKIWVKPNFVQKAEVGDQESDIRGQMSEGGGQKSEVNTQESGLDLLPADLRHPISEQTPFALFVGRLSPEKGCDMLIRAWHRFTSSYQLQTSNAATAPQLIVVGDGPERENLESLSSKLQTPNSKPQPIHFLGKQPKERVLALMRSAQFLISPSICYETFGLVVLEAGTQGTPAIVSEPGTVAALINNGDTGLLYPMGDDAALAVKISWAFDHPKDMAAMGEAARKAFKEKFSMGINYQQLIEMYGQAMRLASGK